MQEIIHHKCDIKTSNLEKRRVQMQEMEIVLKINFGQILYKWENGDNIQVLLTTKATFFLLR